MKAEETWYFALLQIISSLTLLFWSCRVRGTLSKHAGEKSGVQGPGGSSGEFAGPRCAASYSTLTVVRQITASCTEQGVRSLRNSAKQRADGADWFIDGSGFPAKLLSGVLKMVFHPIPFDAIKKYSYLKKFWV
jgi:hypothetical protein